jgi:hypothetical protein
MGAEDWGAESTAKLTLEEGAEDWGLEKPPRDTRNTIIATPAEPDPNRVLQLARETLLGLALATGITEVAYSSMVIYGKEDSTKVFETLLVTVIPSLATLIVGFYFGKKSDR